jgi:hypothetical protein
MSPLILKIKDDVALETSCISKHLRKCKMPKRILINTADLYLKQVNHAKSQRTGLENVYIPKLTIAF